MRRRINNSKGLSLVEVVVVLTIILALGGIFVATLLASKTGDFIDRGAQAIYNDVMFIRGRALSANTEHRVNFLTDRTWQLQAYNDLTSAWYNVSDLRRMPADTYLTSGTFATAGANLVATPRGLFTFGGGSIPDPFVTVTGLGATKLKSIRVHEGGAIELAIQ